MTRRRGALALRALAAMGVAASLAGCYTQRDGARRHIPNDYRERHPITLKEGVQTVELFVGSKRGGLTPTQRADVLAFAQTWRREATGGIIIDVPDGGPTDRAAADSLREVRAILAAAGVPAKAVFVRSYAPSGALARQHQDQLLQARRRRPARAGCGRTISARSTTASTSRTATTGTSAAPASATSPPWSTIRPTWCSRAAKRRPIPPAAPSLSTNTARAKARRHLSDDSGNGLTTARSATSANDQTRATSGSRRT